MVGRFTLAPEAVRLYQVALAHYRKGEYTAALDRVAALAEIDHGWLQRQLLHSYILRSLGDTPAERGVLQALLAMAANMQLSTSDQRLVADAASLLGAACRRLGYPRESVDAFTTSAELESSWPAKAVELSNALFAANSIPDFSVVECNDLYQHYDSLFRGIQTYMDYPWHHDRIRVGYLSHDFRRHAAAQFMTAFFADHDRTRFCIYGYQANLESDAVTESFRVQADEWRDIGLFDAEQTARCIHTDEIDILVELGGHTEENRLPVLAWHPARIQLSGIGYMGSTGLSAVDVFLSDCWCVPQEDADPFFTEPILRLPHSHFCYTPLQPLPRRLESPAARNGFVTFACFNNFSKVTDEQLLLWREILTRLPSSRLILKSGHFDHESERQFIAERLQRLALPLARIECRGLSSRYLEEYGEIDIALDTYPYVGGLTTCEALLCGVPVVSLYGQRHGTRFGLSFLANIGLKELAAEIPAEYVERAVGLAQDTELLRLLRQQLPERMIASPLMDRAGYMRDLEEAFERLYREEEQCAERKYSSMPAAAGKDADIRSD